MSKRVPGAEKELRALQRLLRRQLDDRATPDLWPYATDVPDHHEPVTGPPFIAGSWLMLIGDEVEAYERAIAALEGDLRFEHMGRINKTVWEFAIECRADRSADHVPAFVARHAHEVKQASCYIPIEFLTIQSEIQFPGLALVPVNDPQVPLAETWLTTGHHFVSGMGHFTIESTHSSRLGIESRPRQGGRIALRKPTGCVAVVHVEGTDYSRMLSRARQRVDHVLRGLRVALAEAVGSRPEPLRFRQKFSFSFGDRLSHSIQKRVSDHAADEAYFQSTEPFECILPEDVSDLLSHPALAVPDPPRNDVDRKAVLAMSWIERAYMTSDKLVSLLYRFFALEALLGDKSEGLKAHGLAFREMMLSHIVSGGFRHPDETFFLYDQVRSAAVHGEEAPVVTSDDAASFAKAVYEAVGNYLTLANSRGITRRGKLLEALDNHPDRSELIARLREDGDPNWTNYLDKLEGTHGPR
jgi:hypothetical protein